MGNSHIEISALETPLQLPLQSTCIKLNFINLYKKIYLFSFKTCTAFEGRTGEGVGEI